MRTTAAWAFKRRLQYGSLYGSVVLIFLLTIYFSYFLVVPTCFDLKENGNETGTDCGGDCVRICSVDVFEPSVRWAKSFRVGSGQYNAVAYVENSNQAASAGNLKYTFKLYDQEGLITEVSGSTILPPNNVYPVFESAIDTGGRIPEKTFLELEKVEVWQPSTGSREKFSVISRELGNVSTSPVLDAVLRNNSINEADEVEVIATLFNFEGTPLTSSRTTVKDFAAETERDIVFTWREPIAATIRSCEIPIDVILAVDLSGSMNDDSLDPPEPLTSVLDAAKNFSGRLGAEDQIGIVTFATESFIHTPLQAVGLAVAQAIDSLTITPEEEVGFTNTGRAFFAAFKAFASGRDILESRKVLILLTDGLATAPEEEPEQYAIDESTALKARGVTIYTIGLGEKVNMEFLSQIASERSFAYQALQKEQVEQIYQTITSDLCETGPTTIDIIPKTDTFFTPIEQ